ncbi:MAG TPA: FAD-binding protein, partial [Chlamydiales bacterium]|nr:FAD-binding protein [Chlamydiales bacterium]
MSLFSGKKFTLVALYALFGISSFFAEEKWQHVKLSHTSNNILHQFDPDQNDLRLLNSIPSPLRHLSYAIYPTSRGYDTARFNYNKRFNLFPHAIITPRTKKEAVFTLRQFKKYKLPFSVRSGGHCIQAGSLSPGYIFDLRHFNQIVPNVKRKEVYIGAGARLGDVIDTLGKLGFAIPSGTCSSVGVGGLTLGGGVGFLSRAFGLTCDSVKSITFLTAKGKIIKVDHENHPGLFWALRGAGNGSYGIALGITYQMHKVPQVSYLSLKWNWSGKLVHKVFQAWQKWIKTLPENISPFLNLSYQNQKLLIEVEALKVGSSKFTEWKKAFSCLKPKVKLFKGSYTASARLWADRAPYPFLKSKSEMIMKPLSHKPVQLAIDFLEDLKKKKSTYYAF